MEKTRASAVQRQPTTKPSSTPPDRQEPRLGDDHPLNDILGTHEGEVWEEIRKSIQRNRKKVDRLYWSEE